MKAAKAIRLILIITVLTLISGCGGVKQNGGAQENAQDEPVSEMQQGIEIEEESSEEPTFFVHPREIEEVKIAADYPFDWEHGSCKYLKDRTVIVSIFLSDSEYAWNPEDDSDIKLMDLERERLGVATDWIVKEADAYGIVPEFLFDWKENNDLKYMVAVDEDICNTENEESIWKIIEDEVESDALLSKYNAVNILYMIIQNIPKNWDLNALTWIYEEDDYPYEYTLMYPYYKGETVGAPSYAHEILHAFGAHDLYIANDNETYVVTEDYLKYLKEIGSRDIMYTVVGTDNRQPGNAIPCEFSGLDAYYVGIGDEPEEVEEYGLDKSEY